MLKIRQGFFETNSSSTHSMVIIGDKERRLMEKNKFLIEPDGETLLEEEYDKLIVEYNEWKKEFEGLTIEEIATKIENMDADYNYGDIEYDEDESIEKNLWKFFCKNINGLYDNPSDWVEAGYNEYLEEAGNRYVADSGEVIEAYIVFGRD